MRYCFQFSLIEGNPVEQNQKMVISQNLSPFGFPNSEVNEFPVCMSHKLNEEKHMVAVLALEKSEKFGSTELMCVTTLESVTVAIGNCKSSCFTPLT